jgi:hypothetical protein
VPNYEKDLQQWRSFSLLMSGRLMVLVGKESPMGFDRDYMLNGRPFATGINTLTAALEYGKDDEHAGVSFADALRSLDVPVAEGVVIDGEQVKLHDLAVNGLLMYGPKGRDSHCSV